MLSQPGLSRSGSLPGHTTALTSMIEPLSPALRSSRRSTLSRKAEVGVSVPGLPPRAARRYRHIDSIVVAVRVDVADEARIENPFRFDPTRRIEIPQFLKHGQELERRFSVCLGQGRTVSRRGPKDLEHKARLEPRKGLNHYSGRSLRVLPEEVAGLLMQHEEPLEERCLLEKPPLCEDPVARVEWPERPGRQHHAHTAFPDAEDGQRRGAHREIDLRLACGVGNEVCPGVIDDSYAWGAIPHHKIAKDHIVDRACGRDAHPRAFEPLHYRGHRASLLDARVPVSCQDDRPLHMTSCDTDERSTPCDADNGRRQPQVAQIEFAPAKGGDHLRSCAEQGPTGPYAESLLEPPLFPYDVGGVIQRGEKTDTEGAHGNHPPATGMKKMSVSSPASSGSSSRMSSPLTSIFTKGLRRVGASSAKTRSRHLCP